MHMHPWKIYNLDVIYGGQLITDCHWYSVSTDFYTIFIISNRKLHEGKLVYGREVND